MYKELDVNKMSTGELAKAYQKLDKVLKKGAGGCWELGGVRSKPANQHRIYLTAERLESGEIYTEVVRTVHLVRKRYGYTANHNELYERSCNNPYCVNPAHQTRPTIRGVNGKACVTEDQIDMARKMRTAGWSVELIKDYTTSGAYKYMLDETSESQALDLNNKVAFDKLINIANLYKTLGNPTIGDLVGATGLSVDQLLPYGYAVNTISSRCRSAATGPDKVIKMLEMMSEGRTNSDIAKLLEEQLIKVQSFRGALYG